MPNTPPLRLFQIVFGKTILYFNNKMAAKAIRDEHNSSNPNNPVHVTKGPDHCRNT